MLSGGLDLFECGVRFREVETMLDKAELGKRVKLERLSKGMTLKQVAEASGMSPTHISEIERGRTSPTVGALLRIAHALGRSATFFVEEDRLPTVSIVRGHERVHHAQTEKGRELAGLDFLTTGIPAGRLRVARISSLSSDGMDIPPREGEEILLVNSGLVRVTVGLRVTRHEELRGLDIGEHGQEAYAGFQIFTTE